MQDWHRTRFLESRRGHGRTEVQGQEILSYIRWCFKDARDAEEFKAAFGGVIASRHDIASSRFCPDKVGMLHAASLSALKGIRHAFFTRTGGVSQGVYA